MSDPARLIEQATGRRPVRLAPLSGGSIGRVLRADMPDGAALVAKIGGPGSGLACEGWMLRYLAAHSELPLPEVIHADDGLLLMSHIPAGDTIDARAERHAAVLIADLHDVAAPEYGLERETRIGGLVQPNPQGASWRAFFRDHRLLYMARQALEAGRLDGATMARIERLAGRLDEWIDEPARPSLLHGDLWTGNVLVRAGRIAGLIDPAIYYGDAEMDLAFATLFGTFGDAFFARYAERRPIRPGFFEIRRDLCNLYPLLVHVRLFGGHYVDAVRRVLESRGV